MQMQMQMQRRLTAGANRGTLGGASGRQTECCFVRPGGDEQPFFSLFSLAPGFALLQTGQGERGTEGPSVCELGERRRRQGRERERERSSLAGWIEARFRWLAG